MSKSVLLRSCAFLGMSLAAAAAVPSVAVAQQITTEINGQVTNEAGQPLAGAEVVVTDTRTGASSEITANEQGLFSARNLQTGGPYSVTATASGYQGQTVQNITTTLQGATQLTFTLSPVAADVADATIVVTGTRARVTQLETGPGTSFGAEVMENAPSFNRDVRDIIRLDPRVSLNRDDFGGGADRISCLGGNDRGNAFTVDGIAQSDIYGLNDTGFSARSSTPLPYEAIRETQVQFAPFDVEYGQFTGCAINVVTKSGTNRFRGNAFYEYSDGSLRGDTINGEEVGAVEPDKRWGVALGGPIIRDRLFFFGAFERQRSSFSQDEGLADQGGFPNEINGITVEQFDEVSQILRNVYGIDPGPLVTSRPFKNDRYFGRLDWQVTDDHRLEGTYQHLEESTLQADDLFTTVSSPQIVGLNTFRINGTVSDYYSARLYSNWTDQFSTELRYSRSDVQDLQDPIGGGEAQSDNPIPRIIVGIDNAPFGTSPFGQTPADAVILGGPGRSRSANDLKTRLDQYRVLASYDAGNHRLKAGIELNRADVFNLFVQNATGTLVFRNIADLEAGLLSPGIGSPSQITDTRGFNVIPGNTAGAFGAFSRTGDVNDAAAEFVRSIYTVYAQDDWRVNDRLDLVLGLRADIYSGDRPDENPNFVTRYGITNAIGFSDIDPLILPRLGFKYETGPFGFLSEGRLQGGVGVFSGGDPLVWFSNAFQNNGYGFAEGTSESAACPAGQIDVVVNGQFTGVPQCIREAGIDTAAAGLGNTQSTDPNIKMPTVWRANIGYQTELNFSGSDLLSGWRMNLDYIYSRYRNPFGIVDLSQTIDIRAGRNGYTADGRPIYASIDPTRAGCDAELVSTGTPPVFSNVTAACFTTSRFEELQLTNTGDYESHIASVVLSKRFAGGLFTGGGSKYFTAGYAYTNAEDRSNMYSSTAGSNYDNLAAFDRQNPAATRGYYESRHNLTLSGNFREEFVNDLATTFGFTFVARSGRPYSLTFNSTDAFGTRVGSDNALLYIPTGLDDPNLSPTSDMTGVQQLIDFTNGLDCADGYSQRTIERNTCTNDWYYDLDLRFAQELPGFGTLAGSPYGLRDKVTVYAMFDNFLNILNDNWNVQRRRQFAGLQELARFNGVDAQGRYIIGEFIGEDAFDNANEVNTSSSVWRVKVGISYEF